MGCRPRPCALSPHPWDYAHRGWSRGPRDGGNALKACEGSGRDDGQPCSARMSERSTDGRPVIVASFDGSRTPMHADAFAAGIARRQKARPLVVVGTNCSAPYRRRSGPAPATREEVRSVAPNAVGDGPHGAASPRPGLHVPPYRSTRRVNKFAPTAGDTTSVPSSAADAMWATPGARRLALLSPGSAAPANWAERDTAPGGPGSPPCRRLGHAVSDSDDGGAPVRCRSSSSISSG